MSTAVRHRLRARPGELAVATLTLGAVALLATPLLGAGRTATAAVAGVLLGVVVYGLEGERPAVLAIAGAGGVLVAPLVASVVVMGLALFRGGLVFGLLRLLAVLAVTAAAAAAALATSEVPGGGSVKRAAGRLGAGTLAVVVALSVIATAAGTGLVNPVTLALALAELVVGFALATGTTALPSAVFALALALVPTWLLLRRLRVEVLVDPARRERVAATLDRLRRATGLAALAVVLLGPTAVAVAFVTTGTGVDGIAGALPLPLSVLVEVLLGVAVLRYPLVALGGLATLALVGDVLRRRLRGRSRRELARLAAPVVSITTAALVVAVLLVASGTLAAMVESLPAFLGDAFAGILSTIPGALALGLAVVTAALAATLGLLVATTLAGVVGVLPDRTAGTVLAAGAVFVLALVAMLAGQLLAGLVGAAAAMVVWDAGETAAGLDEEIGEVGSLRVELVRLGAGAAVGVGAVLAVGGVLAVVGAGIVRPASESLAVVGVVLGLAAAAAAVFALRG